MAQCSTIAPVSMTMRVAPSLPGLFFHFLALSLLFFGLRIMPAFAASPDASQVLDNTESSTEPPLASVVQSPPSHPPESGCEWRPLVSERIGLALWVQACETGKHALRWEITDKALLGHSAPRQAADKAADPIRFIEFFDLNPGESPVAGIQRIFRAQTADPLQRRGCVIQPYRGRLPTRPGAYRYSVIPSARYAQALAGGPQPEHKAPYPCGEWGEQYDHVQYFEVQPASRVRKLLFVRTGPAPVMFDEQSVRLFSPHSGG